MEKTKRTPKMIAQANAKAVNDINKLREFTSIMSGQKWFDNEKFAIIGFDYMVSKICKKHKVKESHIRTIGQWCEKNNKS